MDLKRWALLGVSIVLIFVLGSPLGAARLSKSENVICEDGEEFVLAEREAILASKIPEVKDELIVVDTRKLCLTYYREGKPTKTYPVAIGEPKTPSPIGEWRVIHKGGNWGDGFGVRWIGINVPWGIYGIHGTNKPYSIGTRGSHGCIRLLNSHVLELYKTVKLGTPVHIVGNLPKVNPRRELTLKNTGRDVVYFQFALRYAGFPVGAADGRFGPEMEQGVCAFQNFYGLPISGKITQNEHYLLGLR